MQGISCPSESGFGPCTFHLGAGVPGASAAGAAAAAGLMPQQGPRGRAWLHFGPEAGCWSCTGVQNDGLHGPSSTLGHQQGEGGKGNLAWDFIVTAIQFGGLFWCNTWIMAGGVGASIYSAGP